jgi:hypothetical protein
MFLKYSIIISYKSFGIFGKKMGLLLEKQSAKSAVEFTNKNLKSSEFAEISFRILIFLNFRQDS